MGYRHLGTEYREGKVIHHVERVIHKRTCKACGAPWRQIRLDGRFERTREPIPCAKGSSRYIRAFGRFLVMLCGIATIKNVARFLGVGWDLVKDAFRADLQRRHKRRPLKKIRYIAVDEFATHKGHKYMTVVLDLESGGILHAQEGKDAAVLAGSLLELKRGKAPIKAVAADMSEAYASAVREVFGDSVDLVHDPFHVTALASKAIDETRRDLFRQLQGEEKKVVKGSRFLLLRVLENLKPSGMTRLMELTAANEPLYQAYLLKEDLRMFWSLPDADAGAGFLDQWIGEARSLGNRHFTKLAATLEAHRPGLLAYFRHRISTGPLEGLNNKIKVLKRQAYGSFGITPST